VIELHFLTSIQRGWLATTKECHSTTVPDARKGRSSTSERVQRGWLATTKECHSTIVPYARKVRSSTSERL